MVIPYQRFVFRGQEVQEDKKAAKPSQDKELTTGGDLREALEDRHWGFLAIPAFGRIAGINNKHLIL